MSNFGYNIDIMIKKSRAIYSKIVVGDEYLLDYPARNGIKRRGSYPSKISIRSKNESGKNKLKFPLIVQISAADNAVMLLSYYKLRKHYIKI